MPTRNDINSGMISSRSLEYFEIEQHNVRYPTSRIWDFFEPDNSAGPGAASITYDQYDTLGIAKLISSYADDFPPADVKGKQFTIPIHSLGTSYGYSIQEERYARYSKTELNAWKAIAARRANDNAVENIGWYADGTNYAGMYGILRQPNITKAAAVTGTWSTATADQIVADMVTILNAIRTLTKDICVPTNLLIPISHFTKMQTTPRTTQTDTTILEFMQKNYPKVEFGASDNLYQITNPRTGSGTVNVMVAWMKDKNVVSLKIPLVYESFAPQLRNMQSVVPCHSRIAGIHAYQPLAIYVCDGI